MDEFVDYFSCNQWNKCWNEIATSLKINLAKMNKTLHKSAIVLGIVLQLGGDRWLITLIVVLMFYFITTKNNFIVTIAWRQQWLITTKMTGQVLDGSSWLTLKTVVPPGPADHLTRWSNLKVILPNIRQHNFTVLTVLRPTWHVDVEPVPHQLLHGGEDLLEILHHALDDKKSLSDRETLRDFSLHADTNSVAAKCQVIGHGHNIVIIQPKKQSNLNYRCQQNFKILRIFTNQLPISKGCAAKHPNLSWRDCVQMTIYDSVLIDS